VCGGVLPQKHAISCILSIQICSKTILVFEIKEGTNAQKVKKNINRNLSIRGIILRGILLIRGIIPFEI
jgi:hypothetical protein